MAGMEAIESWHTTTVRPRELGMHDGRVEAIEFRHTTGLCGFSGMKRETLLSLMTMPSLSNSPWIFGAPQVTLASARGWRPVPKLDLMKWP